MKHLQRFYLSRCVRFALLVLLLIGAVAWAVMALWNWLFPALFGWPAINYWQAAGLLVLCRLLVGHPPAHMRGGKSLAGRGRRHWREHMRERWQQLPEEERSRLREHMRRRWRC